MKKILLAEDDPFVLGVYSNILRKEGYLVEVARDGQEAFKKAQDNCPDLLILDIMLPKVNGCQLLRAIRQNPVTKNIHTIVISNLDQKDYPEAISNLGVAKFLLKIKSAPDEIISAVKEILN